MGPSASSAGRPRRAYATVQTAPTQDGFAVLLDARPVKTPGGKDLVLPTRALAALIAEEWAGQGDHVDVSTMPATRLAFTVVDRTGEIAERMGEEVARYAASDVVCYFAEGPAVLVERQAAHWGPMLDWAREALGVDLRRTAGSMPVAQPPEALARIATRVAGMEPFTRAGVALATPLFGSAVLALALAESRLDADAAFDLSRLDEAFQEERWGSDADATARTAGLRGESRQIERWFRALAAR